MIITRTPVRISFLGGGTDYPDYFRRHGGCTLGATIDKYSYITATRMAPLFDYSIRVGYSRTELASAVDQVEHPSVRECLRFTGVTGGLELNYMGDLPARTGLGSSSSFTVGLLHALHAFKGELASQTQLAAEAVHVEQDLIRERVGVQDQYTCAVGGLLHLRFSVAGTVAVAPLPLSAARLAGFEAHLMLFYTGVVRHAHAILEEQIERTKGGTNDIDLSFLAGLVEQGVEILSTNVPLTQFGELLHAAWIAKKRLSSKISNSQIDASYEAARGAGAIGGKLLGAGGGGFLLLLAKPETHAPIERALQGLRRIPFHFETGGSRLLFYQP